MILQCSNCNARFLVPDSAIGAAGRTVRCARCGHTWHAKLEAAPQTQTANGETIEASLAKKIPEFEEMIDSVNEKEKIKPKPLSRGSNLPVQRKSKAPAALVGSVAVAACVVVVTGLFMKMPSLFGMAPSIGVVLSDVKMEKHDGEKISTVEISGNITNETDAEVKIPTLRIMLLTAENSSLESREYDGNGKTLKPKESITFATGDMPLRYTTANKFVVELGTTAELMLRRKP